MTLNRLGVGALRDLLLRGEVTPLEVIDDTLAAIDAREGQVGAFLELYADDARAAARRLTESGDLSAPLAGVPIALKDNLCTKGRRTTCASKILEGYRSLFDATVVERLTDVGAIVIGKTNLDEFAMGSSTENSALGQTHNPWRHGYAPGGSSGGSAAAVAADFSAAALGSDTGGSIRQPASFCGVVGMKPSYGRVSRYGLVAFASSLDQIGPMTKDVRDAALVLNVICGRDPRDSTSSSQPVPDFTRGLDGGLAGMRLGVPRAFLQAAGHPDVRSNFDAAVAAAESAGASIVDIELPNADYGLAAYYVIANAEASANLARYDGVKYGHRSSRSGRLLDMYTRTREEGFGAEVKRRILLGTYVLSAGYYDAYYHKAQQVRSLIIRDFAAAFERCDLVFMPTSPTPAFALGERSDDPVTMYLSDVFTIPVNLAGLPGISIPSGLSSDGLPLGVQLVGKAFDETAVLRGAAGLEAAIGFEERAF